MILFRWLKISSLLTLGIIYFSGSLFGARDSQAFDAKTFEHSAYRILYRLTGQQKTLDASGAASAPLEEIIYKVSLLDSKESIGDSPTGWLEIRFLDSNDYILVSDLVSHQKLLEDREHYAYLWISRNKLTGVQDVRLQPLNEQEFPAARTRVLLRQKLAGDKTEGVIPQISEQISQPSVHSDQESSPDHLELNREKKLSIIDQNIERIQAMLGRSANAPTGSIDAQGKGSNQDPQVEETDLAMESERSEPRLTNDDLMKFLKEADAQPATIEETQTVTE